MVLKTLEQMGPLHGYGIARRIEQIGQQALVVNQGTIYLCLVRLLRKRWISARWGTSENNRKARFYAITKGGLAQLKSGDRELGADFRCHRPRPAAGRVPAVAPARRELRCERCCTRCWRVFASSFVPPQAMPISTRNSNAPGDGGGGEGPSWDEPGEARREARLEMGGATQLREAARAARGLPWLETFLLDGKLGLRMLRRSWGLTLVGGLAMAITIGLGASIFTIWNTFAGTRLPLDEGDRVVAIQSFDRASQRVHMTTPLADFRRWRETLTSVEYVSAMRAIDPEVLTRDGAVGPVHAAEMTASAFQLARVQPLLGRPLIDQDERVGAEPVAVIGYDLWQSAFSSDPAVLGQRIQVDDTSHIIVGVMPDRFRFPLNQRLWIPLRIDPVGRGASRERRLYLWATRSWSDAGTCAERSRHARRSYAGMRWRRTTAQLEPRVVLTPPASFPTCHANSWASGLIFLVATLLLIPPCANIAILVYARTVTRREEFAARTALGASRGRIVMQLFVEVLVLATGAGIVGFLLARQFSGGGCRGSSCR